jgi:hypothetical protein
MPEVSPYTCDTANYRLPELCGSAAGGQGEQITRRIRVLHRKGWFGRDRRLAESWGF